MKKSNYKTQNLEKVISCLLGVALLNPEMSTVWSRRRELILSRKMTVDNELRLTRMALSRKPKSNEALAHRRWVISEILNNVMDKATLLQEELTLCEMIANRYHSNYHAWSHRIWTLQHLLPSSMHWNVRKRTTKSTILDVSENNMPQHLFCRVSKSKYLSIVNSETFCVYSEEIDSNFKWVSSHVSDHSGFHFRKFLITQICEFLKSNICLNNSPDLEKDENLSIPVQCNSSSFFPTRKGILKEFLKSLEIDVCDRKIFGDYFKNLEENSSLFDLIVCILISEIKSNHTFCLMFPGHEALWYYRRSIMFMFKKYILDNVHFSEQSVCSHHDKNGVPHKKDFKYDFTVDSKAENEQAKVSDFFGVFCMLLIKHEKEIISSFLKSHNESENKFIKDYEHWLKFCLKIN
ncbi:UNVERIFIED_CONTAM: hypothetical protein PYX00_008797 [Menopon gallinae]